MMKLHRAAGVVLVSLVSACGGPRPAGVPTVEVNLPLQAVDLRGSSPRVMLYNSPDQKVNLLRVDSPVPPQLHVNSEETVYVISGSGVFAYDGIERDIREGDLIVIPRNTPHSFFTAGGESMVLLSMFTPRLQDGDRVFVGRPAAAEASPEELPEE